MLFLNLFYPILIFAYIGIDIKEKSYVLHEDYEIKYNTCSISEFYLSPLVIIIMFYIIIGLYLFMNDILNNGRCKDWNYYLIFLLSIYELFIGIYTTGISLSYDGYILMDKTFHYSIPIVEFVIILLMVIPNIINSFKNQKEISSEDEHSFQAILEHPVTFIFFKEFLDKRLCIENLRFWVIVNIYRDRYEDHEGKLAKLIYKKYICDGSDYEVNVSSSQKKRISDTLFKSENVFIIYI